MLLCSTWLCGKLYPQKKLSSVRQECNGKTLRVTDIPVEIVIKLERKREQLKLVMSVKDLEYSLEETEQVPTGKEGEGY